MSDGEQRGAGAIRATSVTARGDKAKAVLNSVIYSMQASIGFGVKPYVGSLCDPWVRYKAGLTSTGRVRTQDQMVEEDCEKPVINFVCDMDGSNLLGLCFLQQVSARAPGFSEMC